MDLSQIANHSIGELDRAISSHHFHLKYLLAGTGLRNALEASGRLTSLIIDGVADQRAWLLDQEIVVLENTYRDDPYWFHLQSEPIVY